MPFSDTLTSGVGGKFMTRICIVEDEMNIVEALHYLFQNEGWHVDVISDGAEAIKTIPNTSPSLVVLDYMLPSLSGLAVAQQIRADSRLSDVPILMLSAKGQEKDKQQAELAGINKFMTKPFSNSELLEQVKLLLEPSPSYNSST